MHPPLTPSEAIIDADRCYFCYDAPCTTACPTGIDIPGFIQKIRSGNLKGSAHTILSENIMGGMCARVCPTEVLCEEACVRNTHEDRPVRIGCCSVTPPIRIFESETLRCSNARRPPGAKLPIVGGGPAGLSCAHRLAMLGHGATVFEPMEKLGGLNEYGIAAYKTLDDFAAREVEYILSIGGIEVRTGVALGKDLSLGELRKNYDAVFLGFGLAGVNGLGLDGEQLEGVANAVDYIAALRQAPDKASLPVGRRVVVIGGGMTAIDIAVQSKALGAEEVTMVYRRGQENMNASGYEQEFAQTRGVIAAALVEAAQAAREFRTRARRGVRIDAGGRERRTYARGRRGLQGHRAENAAGIASPTPRRSSSCKQDRIVVRRRAPDIAARRVGRRRLRLRRRGSDRVRRAGRQARRPLDRPFSEGQGSAREVTWPI